MPCVLIAVDGSERSTGVFRAGAEWARSVKARVVLFHALFIPAEFPPAAATLERDSLPAYLEREMRGTLDRLLALAPDIACETRIERASQPWSAILATSDSVDADLIVIGSHGYHGWDHVLGTTAGTVANRAHRNVLIVHDRVTMPSPSSAAAH